MLKEDQKIKLSKHLYQIEAGIHLAMQQDVDGPYWLVPHYEGSDPDFSLKQSQEIFNGDCGIALFYIALYELDKQQQHLDLAKQILSRMLRSEKAQTPQFFCFYSGVPDLIYTCLRVFEVTGEEAYRAKALELTLLHRDNIVEKVTMFDLLNGHAGNLLVLTLVYHYHPQPEVLAIIHQIIDKFIEQVRVSAIGLKWNHFKYSFDSMAGFSHGASGMAYALMQVAEYFNYDGLHHLAQQALTYEMQYYDANALNWLDLRLGFTRLGLPDAHLWNINTFLPGVSDVNAWAHGAVGVGLARLYAHKITGDPLYLEQCKAIVKRCKQDIVKMREDYTLCSGYGGMIPFLLRYQQFDQNADLATDILAIANQAMDLYDQKHTYNTFIESNRIDTGLLSGKAGVGYMLINVLTNAGVDDVLCLQLPQSTSKPDVSKLYTKASVQYRVFSRYYSKTIQALHHWGIAVPETYDINTIDEFQQLIDQAIDQLPNEAVDYVRDVFGFEKAITCLWKQHKGFLCYAKKNESLSKSAALLLTEDDAVFLSHQFILCKHVLLHYTQYHQENTIGKTNYKQTLNAVLLCCDENGVNEIYTGQLVALIVAQLIDPITGIQICQALINQLIEGEGQADFAEQLEMKIIKQLRELIRSGLIETCAI